MMGSMPMTSISGRMALPIAAFFAFLLTAFLAMPALAQQQPPQEISPEQLALARKYVDLTDKSGIFETTIVQAGIDSRKTLVSQNPGISDKVDEAIGKVIVEYRGKKDDLFNQFARIYALTFTSDELQQIVDFYGSPVGQKLARANPELNTSLARVLNLYSSNLQREFFANVRAELKSMGIDS
jgi:hypothetical protein